MKKIYGLCNLSITDVDFFHEELKKNIINLQEDGQEVEIQYQTNYIKTGEICYSALVIGRK